MKKYRYSEIFRSIQGEGQYTGVPTVWFRTWGCNFECKGFGANNPSEVDVNDLPYMTIKLDDIKKMDDLPVFEFGCDSSYSWSKRFQHLSHQKTAEDIAEEIMCLLPEKQFTHPQTNLDYHLAFTGGEPMMSQSAIVNIMNSFRLSERGTLPRNITIETNGTQKPRDNFKELFSNNGIFFGELFWSCSPKLSASGEKWEDAIKPDIIREYYNISDQGQLKYVVDGSDKCWREVEDATKLYRDSGVTFPVWIMPVGATLEEQEAIQETITLQAIELGYNVSPRVHAWIFGNKLGT